MVTLGRMEFLRRAVDCYLNQSYPNKELQIVSLLDDNPKAPLIQFLEELNEPHIHLHLIEGEKSLGALRNISINKAQGAIICQWDDDDLYHPDRLKVQYEQLIKEQAEVCFLTSQLHYFKNDKVLSWLEWSNFRQPFDCMPNSIMMRKSVEVSYPEEGPNAQKKEDSNVLQQIHNLRVKIAKVKDRAYMYVYTYHGDNTWQKEHHYDLVKKTASNSSKLKKYQPELLKTIDYFALPKDLSLFYADTMSLERFATI